MSSNTTAFVLAALATAISCPLVTRVLESAEVIDRPNERSSHSRPVPRGGGLACFLGAVVALLPLRAWILEEPGAAQLTVIVTLIGVLGFADDLWTLSPTLRLGIQLSLCGWFGIALVGFAGGFYASVLAAGVIVVWCVTFINAFNFMDGINGISAVTTLIIGLSLAAVSSRWNAGVEIPALILAGGAAGFAPFNLRGRLFLGDVGSYLLGSALAMVGALAVKNGAPLLAVFLPFAIYLADVFHTLARRARRGAPLLEAHREHVYQRLANDLGMGHVKATLVVAVSTAWLAALAQLSSESLAGTVLVGLATLLSVVAYLSLPAIAARVSAQVAVAEGAIR